MQKKKEQKEVEDLKQRIERRQLNASLKNMLIYYMDKKSVF